MTRPRRQADACRMCDRRPHAHGLCNAHYRRLRLYGDPTICPRPNRTESAEDLLYLTAAGVSAEEALARVGWTEQAALRWAHRNRRRDLIRAIRA